MRIKQNRSADHAQLYCMFNNNNFFQIHFFISFDISYVFITRLSDINPRKSSYQCSSSRCRIHLRQRGGEKKKKLSSCTCERSIILYWGRWPRKEGRSTNCWRPLPRPVNVPPYGTLYTFRQHGGYHDFWQYGNPIEQ